MNLNVRTVIKTGLLSEELYRLHNHLGPTKVNALIQLQIPSQHLTILCSQAQRAMAGLDICPLPADVLDSCFQGGADARGGKPPVA